ncbi:Lacal_2735 family protein [Psychroserpens damuponensis]|uniref:Lacal_2735 family protein n=1 Tax=Psychroserpens damuponensis TaxID=943936 RepID=UPI001F4CB426|nr:Lacal_2735 family protein [Psychroserpens damuponensis]
MMESTKHIKANQNLLLKRYKMLIEQAYNFRQTDSALSDISEFKAIKLLHKLNKLKYLNRDVNMIQQH